MLPIHWQLQSREGAVELFKNIKDFKNKHTIATGSWIFSAKIWVLLFIYLSKVIIEYINLDKATISTNTKDTLKYTKNENAQL